MPIKITSIAARPNFANLRYSVGFYHRPALGVSSPPVDYGNTEDEFPDTADFIVAANIIPKMGDRETVLAARLTGRALVTIIVRQSANTRMITTDWMAKDERSGEIFNIRSVNDPEGGNSTHGFYFEMLCESGVAV